MKRSTVPYSRLMATLSLALGMLAFSKFILADEPGQTISDPGFRPETEYAATFLDTADTAKIAVLPTLVRRADRTAHSFKHSLTSAFQTNDVDVTVMVAPKESDPLADFGDQIDAYAPDAIMLINIDPLYRKRRDGYLAIVGTEFEATLIDKDAGKTTWHSSGKVDYIRVFGSRYVAHDGIRKEFAWSTTAAIVGAYMAAIHDRESAPIYTVTEDRERHGQRTD